MTFTQPTTIEEIPSVVADAIVAVESYKFVREFIQGLEPATKGWIECYGTVHNTVSAGDLEMYGRAQKISHENGWDFGVIAKIVIDARGLDCDKRQVEGAVLYNNNIIKTRTSHDAWMAESTLEQQKKDERASAACEEAKALKMVVEQQKLDHRRAKMLAAATERSNELDRCFDLFVGGAVECVNHYGSAKKAANALWSHRVFMDSSWVFTKADLEQHLLQA